MKTFKLIDCWIQIIIISICLVLSVVQVLPFYYAYFIVGGAQLLSMLIHEAMHSFTLRGSARRKYHTVVYVIVVSMISSIWLEPFLFIFVLLLFVAPFMAVYYVSLCYREVYVYMKRPLSILK